MNTTERLRELERAATAGPWRSDGRFTHMLGLDAVIVESGPIGDEAMCTLVAFGHSDTDDETRHNANLAAATRNALPSMLAVIEAAEAYLERHDTANNKMGPFPDSHEVAAIRTALAAFREVRE